MYCKMLTVISAVVFFACTSVHAVTVNVDFENVVGTHKITYGLNEVDRKEYFAGTVSGYPNTTILQNHRDIGTKLIRVFLDPSYGQTLMDAAVKAVVDCGAAPLICFQIMPANSTSYDSYGSWCASMIQRYKGMYDTTNWYWEIINEPNNVGRTITEYVSLYNIVEPKLHAVDPGAKVGGPATAGLDSVWISSLLSATAGRPNSIQFFSWHRYGCWAQPPGPSDTEVLSGTSAYADDIDTVQYLLDINNRKGIKKVIDELGVNAWAGDINGTWNTDPRIKTVFNTAFYASVIRNLMLTPFNNQVDVEMMWEGTGDDKESTGRGFGIWYSQEPSNRAPVFYAKKLIATHFPAGSSLVMVDEGGTSTVEAVGCKLSTPGKYNLLLINKTSVNTSVTINISGITVSSASWWTADSTTPQGRQESGTASAIQNVVMNGYSIKILNITGSQTGQRIHVSSLPSVSSITSTSATIKWTTDLVSSSIVEYGTTAAYGGTATDSNNLTSHTIVLTGLKPGTAYHFRAKSYNQGAGYTGTYSRDYAFTTAGDTGKLVNGDFESGFATGWFRYGGFDDGGNTGVSRSPWRFGITAHSGQYLAGAAASYGTKNGGLLQQVRVNNGKFYRINGWINTYNQNGIASDTNCRIGLDPTGGTDYRLSSVIWTSRTSSPLAWKQLTLLTQAKSSYMTVFLDMEQKWSLPWNINAFDDITFAEIPGDSVSQLKSLATGTEVSVLGLVCTAGTDQLDGSSFYVEDANRTSGIKVTTTSLVKEGDKVNLVGILRAGMGERYIECSSSPTVLAQNNAVPAPFALSTASLGGSALNTDTPGVTGGKGPNNIGLLIKVSGRVTLSPSSGSYFYVDDGSGINDAVSSGIRVYCGSLVKPAVGKTVSVSGISIPEYRGGVWRPNVRARKQGDIKLFN